MADIAHAVLCWLIFNEIALILMIESKVRS